MSVKTQEFFLKRLTSSVGVNFDFYKIEFDKDRIRFLEDKVFSAGERLVTVYARDSKKVFQSNDAGGVWEEVVTAEELGFEPYRIFTTSERKSVFANDKGRVAVFDFSASKEPLFDNTLGDYPWHGSEGVDESESGTVCYAEYQAGDEDKAPIIHVWRSSPPYTEWKPVIARVSGAFPVGEVRHFHICRSDPFHSGKWWLFSGDVSEHIRGWVSNDDGVSWQDLGVSWDSRSISEAKKIQARRALRLTSIDFQEDKLLWGTDDNLGAGKAAVISADRDDLHLSLRLTALAGRNLFRNIIDVGHNGLKLLVTEAKSDITSAQAYLTDDGGKVLTYWDLENKRDEPCFVTQSLGSRRFYNDVAFLPHYGKILDRKIGGIIKVYFSKKGS